MQSKMGSHRRVLSQEIVSWCDFCFNRFAPAAALRRDQMAMGMKAKRTVRRLLPDSGQKRGGSDQGISCGNGEKYVQVPPLSLLLSPTAASGVPPGVPLTCRSTVGQSVDVVTCKSPYWLWCPSPGELAH